LWVPRPHSSQELSHGGPMNPALYFCNLRPDESRVIPAVALLLVGLIIWRLQGRSYAPAPNPISLLAYVRRRQVLLLWMALTLVVAAAYWDGNKDAPFPGPHAGAALCLTLSIPWLAWLRNRYRPSPGESRARLVVHLAPAYCGALVSVIIIAALFGSYFLENVSNERVRLLYETVARYSRESEGHEFAARARRGTTMALTLVAALAATWATAVLWWQCRSRAYSWDVTTVIVYVAAAASVILSSLGSSGMSPGLDSAFGNAMLCASWERTHSDWLVMVSDANNVLGIFVPVVVGFGICLLLEPVRQDAAMGVDHLAVIGDRSRALDNLLYLGAISLAFGILQMSAVYASALAPLPSVASAKTKIDMCKGLSTPPDALKATATKQASDQWRAMGCETLGQEAHDGEVADSAREFARATTLVFGMGFSAVLAAMYLPAMLLLKQAADRLLVSTDNSVGTSKEDRSKEYQRLGIESDFLGKAGKVITALSPLFAGVLANVFGSVG
jgi:hypothetical protein